MAGTDLDTDHKDVPPWKSKDEHGIHTPAEFADAVKAMQPGELFVYYSTEHSIAIDRERRRHTTSAEGEPPGRTPHAIALSKLAAAVMLSVSDGDGLTAQRKRIVRGRQGNPIETTDYVFIRSAGDRMGKFHARDPR